MKPHKTQHVSTISHHPISSKSHEMGAFKTVPLGLPRLLGGKESACQCRRHGFDPQSGKIPHAAEQLNPSATQLLSLCSRTWGAATTEPTRRNYGSLRVLEPVLHNRRSHRSEKPLHCDDNESPLAATREKPVQQWRHSIAKNKMKINALKKQNQNCSLDLRQGGGCDADDAWRKS